MTRRLERRRHCGYRSRVAPDRPGLRRASGRRRGGGYGCVPEAFVPRPRAVALSRPSPPPACRRTPGARRHQRRARTRLEYGRTRRAGPCHRAPPAAPVHRPRRCVAAALPAGHPARAGAPVARTWRKRHACCGGRGLPLGFAPASRVEPAMGRFASRRGARGRTDPFRFASGARQSALRLICWCPGKWRRRRSRRS